MKKSLIVLAIIALMNVIALSGSAWADETVYRSFGRQVVCAPQNGYIVQKREVYYPARYAYTSRYSGWQRQTPYRDYDRRWEQQRYPQQQNNNWYGQGAPIYKGNNGNHYGWFQQNLTQDQRNKITQFQQSQYQQYANFETTRRQDLNNFQNQLASQTNLTPQDRQNQINSFRTAERAKAQAFQDQQKADEQAFHNSLNS